ncbi:hypothetical protein [Bacillus atrophaeus]|nr:hypothetical protein [Bacillus atrophaeus]MCY7866080.1 hypothetical protein [Bacillus spizizenii]MCY8890356.1 hypothetical protein [Bacillus spizizenii]MEC0842080.1 hypothetical protein [Bacillus spizizenii]MED1125302.1 hypothetical protein [Bacillus atrophaeus]
MNEYIKEWNAMVVTIKEIREDEKAEILKEAYIESIKKDVEDRAPEAV